MSSASSATPPAPPPPTALPPVGERLWQIDAALHDLLIARAELLAHACPSGGRLALSPGREADTLRRLLARHRGPVSRRALVQVWREVFAATAGGATTVALCEAETDGRHAQCVREHFGALTRLKVHRSPAQALDEVRAGTAAAAALPVPMEGDPAPWWALLACRMDPRMYVVARLPSCQARSEGPSGVEMLVVAATPPEPSGSDRSLLAFELRPEQSRAHLLAALQAAGFAGVRILAALRDPRLASAQMLVEVDAFVRTDDVRLAACTDTLHPPAILGVYAVPLEELNP